MHVWWVGRLAGIGFTQTPQRKANEDEIPLRKKQLRSCFAVLEGADRGREVSQSRALLGFIFVRRLGYKLKDVAKRLGRDAATVRSLV